MTRVLVTGAGGFIGHQLVTHLEERGCWVRGVDLKYPEYTAVDADEFELLDLRRWKDAMLAMLSIDHVYALAADMGGVGLICFNHATILRNNPLVNLRTIEAAWLQGVERYLFSSSACVYPDHLQSERDTAAVKEEDAYPATPQDAYRWEELISERLSEYYADEHSLAVWVVRLPNIYGPYGTYTSGREKAQASAAPQGRAREPARLVKVWGDGEQARSFCHVTDCVEGIYRLIQSDYDQSLNLGTGSTVSINVLARVIIDVSGKAGHTAHHASGGRGVRGRNRTTRRCARCWAGSRRSPWRRGWSPVTGGSRSRYAPAARPRP